MPALVAGHPFLQERVELLFRCGFRPKEFRREFHRPGDMALKGADEEFVRRHSPIRLLAINDGLQVGEEIGQKFLNALFNFRAGNVLGIVEVKAEVIILDPPLHDGQMPQLGVEQNEFVDVPREEEFRAGVGCLVARVVNQREVVGIAAFRRPRQFYLPGENQLIVCTIDAQIGTLALDAFGLLNFRSLERQSRGVFKNGICPF